MRTIQTISLAGMQLATMIDAIKTDDSIVQNFDVRAYLVEKLEDTFLDIQTEIMLMMQGTIQERIAEAYGDES